MAESSHVKLARIHAKAVYPPVSAWEFEHLKTELVVRERLAKSTIYFIVQRPMLWFDSPHLEDGLLTFNIVDGSDQRMHCSIDLGEVLGLGDGEAVDVSFEFHRDAKQHKPPYHHVAGIRLFKDGQFVLWWSPAKILFEATTRGLPLKGAGDLHAFIDYDVHYIGQAFSQSVWDRLTGHTKFQKVLTLEPVRGEEHRSPALEIALITVEIIGVEETALDAAIPFALPEEVKPIFFRFDSEVVDDRYLAFHTSWLKQGDSAVTNELEAMLITMFDPPYNDVKYESYPDLKTGARAAGYTMADVALTDFPFRLRDRSGSEPLEDAPQ